MAIATATAIALGITAATTTASFVQAAQQRKAMNQAEEEAFKALAEAKSKLNVNPYASIGINKDIYDAQRENVLSAGAGLIDAEGSQRSVGATAGRVMGAINKSNQEITEAQREEKFNLDQLVAKEDANIRNMNVNLSLAEASGAQQAAQDANKASINAFNAGLQGVSSMATQIGEAVPLYGKNTELEKEALSKMQFTPDEFKKFESLGVKPRTDDFSNLDFTEFSSMSNSEYKDFLKTLSPQQRQYLFSTPQYNQAYGQLLNPFTL
jgi:hypothetical protein